MKRQKINGKEAGLDHFSKQNFLQKLLNYLLTLGLVCDHITFKVKIVEAVFVE